jgi:hypothetical protein
MSSVETANYSWAAGDGTGFSSSLYPNRCDIRAAAATKFTPIGFSADADSLKLGPVTQMAAMGYPR